MAPHRQPIPTATCPHLPLHRDFCGTVRNGKTGVVEYKLFQCRPCGKKFFVVVEEEG